MTAGSQVEHDRDQRTEDLRSAVVRFAGDSGDGMQLAGTQFTDTSAVLGNDVATLPDYPAEIRAPAGTVAGVSGFQVNFAATEIHTPGDAVDALIAMNPAAFKANIGDVETGGIVVVNEDEFNKVNLRKAGYDEAYNPLDDDVLTGRYKLFRVPITRLNEEALAESELSAKDLGRCKNMYALGIVYWLFDRPIDQTVSYIQNYFGSRKGKEAIAEANIQALKAGYFFGETTEMFHVRYHVEKAALPPGTYRKTTGNEAMAMGLATAASLAGKSLIYCSYPITPASDVLHYLAAMRAYGIKTFQAEDEIAAVCAAIGASFAGQFGVTGTSGPGLALKSEAINLAVMTELPLVVLNVQRGGPSTGLPTKTEQADLLQAMFGRNGESPIAVIAPRSPSDCFNAAIEASRIALQHMTPVIVLSDGYLANGAEPWRIPEAASLDPIEIVHAKLNGDGSEFAPYARDERYVRPWAVPGTPGLEHRIGGLEKEYGSGNVSYDPDNHQRMIETRQAKVNAIARSLPPTEVCGEKTGKLLVIGWGGTYGSILTAVERAQAAGRKVSYVHLRYLNPMPDDLGDILSGFSAFLVPELNGGQLRMLLRSRYLIDAVGLNKTKGKPFLVEEIEQAIEAAC